ncbi:MAG: V-type ATP synthase subunit I [Spirochaetaceae bacterium]|jgi:V/A-type H+-transporting ATPase subunit I|nr:V-type ATP synthase subunit I [Spirochaetaceae bacterium]
MIRPQKMKQIELTVLERDVDRLITFLGRQGVMQFSLHPEERLPLDAAQTKQKEVVRARDEALYQGIQEQLEKLKSLSVYLGLEIALEPEETSLFPGPAEAALVEEMHRVVTALTAKEHALIQEREHLEVTLNEARAFSDLNTPLSALDQLSYLTLRLGRLDLKEQADLRERLEGRAVIISLGDDRVAAATSRKGRFALDSELKKHAFIPIPVPEGDHQIPPELLSSLERRFGEMIQELHDLEKRKELLRAEYGAQLRALAGSYSMAAIATQLRGKLVVSKNLYVLSGWVPADTLKNLVEELAELTDGRLAVRSFDPDEIGTVKEGKEKVPVLLKHGAFVRSFERIVFSYGAPLYGTIDPTPFVAVFFTILFGIMFGDVGQGFVLLLLGILTGKRGIKALSSFRVYSTPLIAVGCASMVMGLLSGSVFAHEELLVGPTQKVLGFFMGLTGQTGEPPERILHLMPEADNIEKLFYFFGFTLAVGIILTSIGLWVNIINQMALKHYEKALFSKTGIAGVLLFWYALFIAARCLLGGRFHRLDCVGLMTPVFFIFFGPIIGRLMAKERPLLPEGLMVFIVEGFVEILETLSTYISNTVSFLRVGAFALSHGVLSFIIFTLSGMVSHVTGGPLFSLIIMLVGNVVIILLEGMIVAIQVVRLQYYEFFSKFFTETGVEFSPFRFRREVKS